VSQQQHLTVSVWIPIVGCGNVPMERTKDDFDLMRLVMVSVSVTVLWGFVLAARTKSSMWWLVGLGLYWLIVAFSTENWDVDSWASNPVPSSVLVCADVSVSGFVVGMLSRYLGVYPESSVKFKFSFVKNKAGRPSTTFLEKLDATLQRKFSLHWLNQNVYQFSSVALKHVQ